MQAPDRARSRSGHGAGAVVGGDDSNQPRGAAAAPGLLVCVSIGFVGEAGGRIEGLGWKGVLLLLLCLAFCFVQVLMMLDRGKDDKELGLKGVAAAALFGLLACASRCMCVVVGDV